MNWIITSLIMFVSSVCLYLVVRKSSILKLPTQFNNLAMFLVPLLVYFGIAISRNLDFEISLVQLLIIIVTAALFMYLANITSLKSLELAPNPGYSLVISKSYVVFTTLVSYLFLDGQITTKKIFAIVLIVLFSTLVIIDPKKTKKVNSTKWLYYTLYSFFGWGLLSLIIKYLTVNGMDIFVMLTYMYTFVSLFIITEIKIKKVRFEIIKNAWNYFLIIGLFSASFNYFNFYSVGIAPNVGYVNAINASSVSFVTIASAILFKDDMSTRKMIGVIGVIVGLILMIL